MKYKILGKTGLKVSQFGFGAIQICRIPEKDAVDLIRASVEAGINLIDTAHMYPNSEEILGKALRGIRDKVIICTKSLRTDRDGLLKDMEISFKKLDTDYIDIFLFHGISKGEKLDSIINNRLAELLLKEKEKGRIGHIGFSSHDPNIIDKYYEVLDFSAVMIPVNFIATEFVDKNYNGLVENDIGILGMKPLGGGRIEDVRTCFKFINQYEKVIPVIGIQSREELEENLKLIDTGGSLDNNDRNVIEEIRSELGDRFCRGCGYCLPCSQGIDIPEINLLKVFFKQLDHDSVVTPEMDKTVSMVDECIECGECIEKCPYELDIISMIRENRDYYLTRKEKGKGSSDLNGGPLF
jgi:predicted aldo/keto reductase-like oxidoreductase